MIKFGSLSLFPTFFEDALRGLAQDAPGVAVPVQEPLVAVGPIGERGEDDLSDAVVIAPWLGPFPQMAPNAQVLPIEVPPAAPGLGSAGSPGLANALPPAANEPMPAEAVAMYRPWHFYGHAWGIYMSEPPILEMLSRLSSRSGLDPEAIAPLLLRQILAHELGHFECEVFATEVEDACHELLYTDYGRYRFGDRHTYLPVPLEEAHATHREFTNARSGVQAIKRRTGRDLKPYLAAVREDLGALPPGYCDYRICENPSARLDVNSGLASLVRGRPMTTDR